MQEAVPPEVSDARDTNSTVDAKEQKPEVDPVDEELKQIPFFKRIVKKEFWQQAGKKTVAGAKKAGTVTANGAKKLVKKETWVGEKGEDNSVS